MRVAYILPAYNEAEVIFNVIKKLQKALKNEKYDYTIIVVDDGSTDNTASESIRAGATVLSHILNSGSGGATATGLRYANKNNYDTAVTMDADGQHEPTDAINGIKAALRDNYDLLIGSRLLDSDGMSRLKTIGNKGLTYFTYALFGVRVTDSQSGLRIFSKKALTELRWKTEGYEFCSEMLWRAKQENLRIGEYPIQAIYTEYSVNKGQNNWNAFNIIRSLLMRRIMEFFGE